MSDDRREIADLVHRYADAVCRRDEAQWASCWADEAHWTMGPREAEGKEAIVDMWRTAMKPFVQAIQVVFNGTATVDGDRATGRWYINEELLLADDTALRSLNWYDDEYVRTPDGWKFASRRLQPLVRATTALTAENFTTPPS